MNEINKMKRLRVAAEDEGEAVKIRAVKEAEAEAARTEIQAKADAEAKFLGGQGISRQRQAIMEGLRESVNAFKNEVSGVDAKTVMDLMIVTQVRRAVKSRLARGAARGAAAAATRRCSCRCPRCHHAYACHVPTRPPPSFPLPPSLSLFLCPLPRAPSFRHAHSLLAARTPSPPHTVRACTHNARALACRMRSPSLILSLILSLIRSPTRSYTRLPPSPPSRQYFDMMKDVGAQSKTTAIFLNDDVSMAGQISKGFMSGLPAAPGFAQVAR